MAVLNGRRTAAQWTGLDDSDECNSSTFVFSFYRTIYIVIISTLEYSGSAAWRRQKPCLISNFSVPNPQTLLEGHSSNNHYYAGLSSIQCQRLCAGQRPLVRTPTRNCVKPASTVLHTNSSQQTAYLQETCACSQPSSTLSRYLFLHHASGQSLKICGRAHPEEYALVILDIMRK